MDCVNFEDGGTVFAVGCNNGHIYMRIDWYLKFIYKQFNINKLIGKNLQDHMTVSK
jgi:hypothetical protein